MQLCLSQQYTSYHNLRKFKKNHTIRIQIQIVLHNSGVFPPGSNGKKKLKQTKRTQEKEQEKKHKRTHVHEAQV